MSLVPLSGAGRESAHPDVLWEDGERLFCRVWRDRGGDRRQEFVAVVPAAEYPAPQVIDRFINEYALREYLEPEWAVRPVELVRERGQTVLLLEPPGGQPLQGLVGAPLEMGRFLRLSIAISAALTRMHRRGLVHRDLKPINILVDPATEDVWLTGFGIASRLLRERSSPELPELLAGTLAYMAPEQTGRMNRSVDSRSDLYSFGVVLYQMVTAALPFAASEAMEWVHCHIAREPVPPSERLGDVPVPVSALILKLLVKTPEDRYQTAAGVRSDLQRCLEEWESHGFIAPFPLAERDRRDRLMIPEKLYGRSTEIETLLTSFDAVVATGTPALVLVAGYSGIGKSSVVNELHKELVAPRGLFAAGKFDQYKADIPYAAFAQSFRSLIRQLLGKSESELGKWREALSEALGPDGALMVDLVPELGLIIGEQPPVVALPTEGAQHRFQVVVRRFIGVFARPEHPLALFLDDLQWLDAETLHLFGALLTAGDVSHLLLIGAYRDNGVTASHPLTKRLEALRRTGSIVREISLPPLAKADLQQLISDALHAPPDRVLPLAELVHGKTLGNPFFANQFLSSLADEGLLVFDHGAAEWSWDRERTLAKGYSDNVVDLMVRKLARLPERALRTLQRLACLGNVAERAVLCAVCERSTDEVDSDLWEALQQEIVLRAGGTYRFAHDRVQEAAYSLIAQESRPALHLQIGRRLVAHTPVDQRKEAVFEIVNQLNRGVSLILDPEEREQLAELDLLAGRRSKASTAYLSALEYFKAGVAALPADCWERRHELAFSIECARAEGEFLTGDLAAAEKSLAALWAHALNTVERAAVACLRMDVHVNLGQSNEAIAVGLDFLDRLDVKWSARPTAEEVQREYALVREKLGDRAIEGLIDQPRMADATSLAMMDVLAVLTVPAWLTDRNLLCLVTSRAVIQSLTHGNCDASCAGYLQFGVLAGPHFGDHEGGYRFSLLATRLVSERGLTGFGTLTYLHFGQLASPWRRHVRVGREFIRRARESANAVGDFTHAAISSERLTMNLLAAGDPLEEVHRHIDATLDCKDRRVFVIITFASLPQLGLVRSLRGLTRTFGSFDSEAIDERQLEAQLASHPIFGISRCYYFIRKLQARFFAGDYPAALEAASQARSLIAMAPPAYELAEYHFYTALSLAASFDVAAIAERESHRQALDAHREQLAFWSDGCPDNFADRAALVAAEIARLEGRDLEAMRLYDRAVRSAQASGFVHQEAVALELAGRFYTLRGFEDIARLYLRNARHAYVRWGAHGKVRQLDEAYPYLPEVHLVSPASTIATPIDQLDLATVIRVSQAVSSEIILEKLMDALMRAALEHTGAERGLLILARGERFRIEAEAKTGRDTVVVALRQSDVGTVDLPESVFHYVVRTRDMVLLHNATEDPHFSTDAYIREHGSRSVLCLPLMKQARLLGVLYLENNLSRDVFTTGRLSVLKLLASEAATSLENSRLYRDLEERESRMRRLVDSNIIGIFIAGMDGRIMDANEEFLRIVGYERHDVASGLLRWDQLTPAEWREADEAHIADVVATGAHEPYEKEYLRKDGSRISVLLGSALFDDRTQGVAFVLDLSERKRAEEAARQSDRRYHEIQTELSHANRIATLGQLSASIAHEVNQPLTGILMNTGTCLRMLDSNPPNIEGARVTAQRAMRDTNRAANVITRLRALFAKADTTIEPLDLDEAIREVVALSTSELRTRGVSLRLELTDALPTIHGDYVQLQQVMLNLIRNAIDSMITSEDGPRELLIRTSKTQSEVLVLVEDSGAGLDATNLERIFESFYSTKPGGLGVGLAISRAIIEAHQGKLWGAPAVPHGAVFQFTLPVGAPEGVR